MPYILSDYIRTTQEIYIKINHRNKMERELLEAKGFSREREEKEDEWEV